MTLKSCLVLFSIKPMNDNAYKLTKKNSKTDIGGPDSGEGRILAHRGKAPRHREMVPAHRGRASRHREIVPAYRGRASRWREDLPNSSETLRGIAKWFPHTAEGLSF